MAAQLLVMCNPNTKDNSIEAGRYGSIIDVREWPFDFQISEQPPQFGQILVTDLSEAGARHLKKRWGVVRDFENIGGMFVRSADTGVIRIFGAVVNSLGDGALTREDLYELPEYWNMTVTDENFNEVMCNVDVGLSGQSVGCLGIDVKTDDRVESFEYIGYLDPDHTYELIYADNFGGANVHQNIVKRIVEIGGTIEDDSEIERRVRYSLTRADINNGFRADLEKPNANDHPLQRYMLSEQHTDQLVAGTLPGGASTAPYYAEGTEQQLANVILDTQII